MTMSNKGNELHQNLRKYKIQRTRIDAYYFGDDRYDYWKGFADFWGLKIETV